MNKIHDNSSFSGSLGFGSYLGHDCNLHAVKVGRYTSIGPYVRNNFGSHPYKEPFVTTSPFFYSLNPGWQNKTRTFAKEQMFDELIFLDKEQNVALEIGSDCWIGEGALFVGGIRVGNGAVVLARAVVTKDVPDYAIVGGVPAKLLGYRYDEETIKKLLKIKWWNKDKEWLKSHWRMMTDMNAFFDYFREDMA